MYSHFTVRRGRLFQVATVLSFFLLTSSLVVPAARASHPPVPFPVKSMFPIIYGNTTVYGCGSARLVRPALWTNSTQVFTGRESSHSASCAPGNSSYSGSIELLYLRAAPFYFTSSGPHSIKARWAIAVNESFGITPFAGCRLNYANISSSCYVASWVIVWTWIALVDFTNRSWGFLGTGTETSYAYSLQSYSLVLNTTRPFGGNVSSSSSRNGHFSGSQNLSAILPLYGPSKINRSDRFGLFVVVEASTYTAEQTMDASSFGIATSRATLDMATSGNGAHLWSVAVH